MKVNVTEAVQADRAEIENFLFNCDDSFAYHHPQWLEAIKQVYGYDNYYLVAKEVNSIVGILPICIFKGIFRQESYCSLPFCDVGGVVTAHEYVREALVKHALQLLNRNNSKHLEIRQRSSGSRTETAFTNRKVSMLLSLPGCSETLMKGFKSKLRSQIKRAEKNGLTFDCTSEESAIGDFYEIFASNMHRLGSPVHSLKWFQTIRRLYIDNFLVGRVLCGDKVVGVGIIIFSGNNVSIPWASTLREYNHLAPNMWLYWNLLRISCERKCQTFDFGRSTFQEGTFKFKEQWGAKPVLLDWQYLNQSGLSSVSLPLKLGKTRQFFEFFWKRTPLFVANFLGPKLRKHISL